MASAVAAAIFYGILHDQVTVRVCLEYFTVFHPPVFATTSPTALGIGWGIIATWWVGAILGILLGLSARLGSKPKLTAGQIFPSLWRLLAVKALFAVSAGVAGYSFGSFPPEFDQLIQKNMERRFLFDWWAHNASYASAAVGGLVLCAIVWKKRRQQEISLSV